MWSLETTNLIYKMIESGVFNISVSKTKHQWELHRFVTLLELFSFDLSFTKPKLIDLGSTQLFLIINHYHLHQHISNKSKFCK